MAITVVLTQTRPNTGVAFHEGSAEMLALIKEAEDSGKIIDNGGGNDETDLIKTRSFTFPNDEDYIPFRDNDLCTDYENSRMSYNDKNGIIETLDVS